MQLGGSRVMAAVAAEVAAPFGDRPSEGQVAFQVEFSNMAAPNFEAGRYVGRTTCSLSRPTKMNKQTIPEDRMVEVVLHVGLGNDA